MKTAFEECPSNPLRVRFVHPLRTGDSPRRLRNLVVIPTPPRPTSRMQLAGPPRQTPASCSRICSMVGGTEARLRWLDGSGFLSILLIAVLLLLAPQDSPGVSAQTGSSGWSTPVMLFETTGRASEPRVVVDLGGTLHVFWAYGAPGTEDAGSGQAIYHVSQRNGSWSQPIDVVTSPGDRVARMPSVAADEKGYLHIVWSGGSAIYYSRAFAPEADGATGWSSPLAIVSGVTALEPDIAVDPDGRLYTVWSQAGAGLMFAYSDDDGGTWSRPQVAFRADADTELVRWGRLAVDEASHLHLVLTHTMSGFHAAAERENPNFLYYLRSEDHGETWTDAFPMAESAAFGEMNVVTSASGGVHVAWNGRAGRHGRYHRWSADGGRNWSPIYEVLAADSPIATGGLTGSPAMAVDATGTLHLISATGGGDYYFFWAGGQWSPPLLIFPDAAGLGPSSEASSTRQPTEYPSVAVGDGNQLHAVASDARQRIWYTGVQVDAPYEEPLGMPSPTPGLASSLNATESPAPSPSSPVTVPITDSSVRNGPKPAQMPFLPTVIGIGFALIVVAIVVLGSQWRHR